MGLVRFLLAAAVVFHHSNVPWNLPIVDGHQAVRLFYIISGFYMALILEKKYPATREGLWLFYTNRAARIFPTYWMVLLGAVLFYGLGWLWLGRTPERLGWYAPLHENGHGTFLAGLGFSQLTLFGLDWFSLFDYQGSQLGWAGTVSGGRTAGFLCLVPQAWTLAVELCFYLCAPWLARRRTGALTIVCVVGFAVRIGLIIWKPATTAAWNYYWFPLQLPFFLLGILSYRWGGLTLNFWGKTAVNRIAKGCGLALILGYQLMPAGLDQVISCIGLALVLPGLLHGESSWLRSVGELSYPIYLVHILMKWILLSLNGVERTGQQEVQGWLLLTVSLVVAFAMEKLVEGRIEKWRQSRIYREQTA
ncbi:MAG: acyltransferase [Verrucomicrobia bacterium]|nr:acyltransferase [Verrucomicrobiota bacterium]